MPLQWKEWIDQKQLSPTKFPSPAPREPAQPAAKTAEPPRGFIAEWTVTIILLLFGTTTLVQAFVIPTGSMEDTLLVGDHLLVDKLAFAPGGSVTTNLLPYSDVHRGDIIVFRYPIDIKQTFVKRVMGVAGDHIRLENKKVFLNGHLLNEPYVVHKLDYIDSYRDNFPADPNTPLYPPAQVMLEHNVKNGEVIVPPGYFFAMGDNRDQSLDSRYWGFVPRENIIGKPLIIYWSYDATTEELSNPAVSISHLFDIATHFVDEDALEPHAAADSFLPRSISPRKAETFKMARANYYGLILAGGRGTRFWPRSRKRHAKQVLNVTGERTLIQATVDRLAPVIPPERIWILTNDFVRDEIVRQLPEVPPVADHRGTGAAEYGPGDRAGGPYSALDRSESGVRRLSFRPCHRTARSDICNSCAPRSKRPKRERSACWG